MNDDVIGSTAMVVLLLAILYAAYIAMGHVLGKGKGNKTAKEEVLNLMGHILGKEKGNKTAKEEVLNLMGHILGKEKGNKTAKEEVLNSMGETILNIIMVIGIIAMYTFLALYFVFNILGEDTIRSELSKGMITVSDIGTLVSFCLSVFLWSMTLKEEDLVRLYNNLTLKNFFLQLTLAILLGMFFASLVVCGVGVYGFYFQGMGGEVILYALFASLASMFLTQVLSNIEIYENKGGIKHLDDLFKK